MNGKEPSGDETIQHLIDLMHELETVEEMAYQLRVRIADITAALVRTRRH